MNGDSGRRVCCHEIVNFCVQIFEYEVLFSHNLCRVRGMKELNTPRASERKRVRRSEQGGDRREGRASNIEVLVHVCSTCALEEFSDFMLCSKTLSSSSTLRVSLLVGVGVRTQIQTIQTTESMQIVSTHAVTAQDTLFQCKQILLCIRAQSSN